MSELRRTKRHEVKIECYSFLACNMNIDTLLITVSYPRDALEQIKLGMFGHNLNWVTQHKGEMTLQDK